MFIETWVVTEKPYYPRQLVDLWSKSVSFPVVNRGFRYPHPIGDLSLQQS